MSVFKNRPLALCCLCFLISFALSLLFSLYIKIAVIALALVAATIVLIKLKKFNVISASCIFVICATLLSIVYNNLYIGSVTSNISSTPKDVIIQIDELTSSGENRSYYNGKVLELGNEKQSFKTHFALYGDYDLKSGDIIKTNGTITELSSDNYGFDEKSYYLSKDIYVGLSISEGERVKVIDHKTNIKALFNTCRDYCSKAIDRYVSRENAPIIKALAIGDKSDLAKVTKRDFARIGASHMLAISGMHLTIIMGCLIALLDVFKANKRVSSIVVILACIFYIFITGCSSSVLRAGIMFIIMSSAFFFARPRDSITSLFVAVTLIIICSPSSVYDVGLILSFTSTFGIVAIVGDLFAKSKGNHKTIVNKIWFSIKASVITTVSAFAFSIIPLVIFFDSVSVIGILSNLVLAELLSVILFVIPVFILTSFIPIFATYIGVLLGYLAKLLLYIVGLIARIPKITVSTHFDFIKYLIVVYAIGLVICFALRKPKHLIIPLLMFVFGYGILYSAFCFNIVINPIISFESVTSNDTIAIRRGFDTVVFDYTNNNKTSIKREAETTINSLYSYEIDNFVISHLSEKSVSCFCEMANTVYVRNIYLPKPKTDFDRVALEELKYQCEKYHTKVHTYNSNKKYDFSGIEFAPDDNITFDKKSICICAFTIKINNKQIKYIGRGYYDSCEYDGTEGIDTVFLGGMGAKNKKVTVPSIKCEDLIYYENAIESGKIESENAIILDKNNKQYILP